MEKTVSSMLIIYILCGLVFVPGVCISAASDGVTLCAGVIIPSLFPFFVCSKMLVQNGFAEKISRPFRTVMRPLFNVPGCGAFAFAVGILSGCPVGAKTVCELYSSGACTKAEAQRMICFCNNSGPLFIIGSVVSGMMGFPEAGGMLYASHVVSAVVVGIIMSFYKRKEKISKTPRFCTNSKKIGFPEAVAESVNLALYVCGFVIFFAVVTAILQYSGMVEILMGKTGGSGIVYGMLEMTNGISSLCGGRVTTELLSFVSFVLGFGGLSVIMQVGGIVKEYGLSTLVFAAAKLVQGLISAVLTVFLASFCKISLPVFSRGGDFSVPGGWAVSINLFVLFGIIILIMSILSIACKKMR